MPAPGDGPRGSQVAEDSRLTESSFCLNCSYSLRGLPTKHPCPECGHLADRDAERQEVMDLINQPMLKLGWRMSQFWKPLPVGWWWVLDQPQDRHIASRRALKWFAVCCLLLTILSVPTLIGFDRVITTTTFWHPQANDPVIIETYNDHRMAMAFGVLGLARPGISIANPKCVAKSYPGFWKDFAKLYQ